MASIILDKLEAEPVSKLLWKYSIPSIVSSLVIAFYNLIDSIYIAWGPNLGDHAIGGLGIVLPVMTLVSSLGLLVGTGATSRISIALGKKEETVAKEILGNAFILVAGVTLFLVAVIFCFLEQVLNKIGATSETFVFAHEFLLYYLPSCFFFNLNFVLCGVMRASGYPSKAMYIALFGVVLNVILAPIFIFGLEWGMKGAAIATSLSTFISIIPAILHFTNANNILHSFWSDFKLNARIIWAILSIGLSPFIVQMGGSIIVIFINTQLKIYGGSVAIEAYTVANRLSLVVILVILGLTQGMQPIIGYNLGANRIDRVVSTTNYAIKIGIVIGLIGTFTGCFLAETIVSMFNLSANLSIESVRALQIITVVLFLSGFQMVISGLFQSIAKPLKSMSLNLARQFIFLLSLLYLLPFWYGLDGVWMAIPASDLISSVLALILYMLQLKKWNINKTNIAYSK